MWAVLNGKKVPLDGSSYGGVAEVRRGGLVRVGREFVDGLPVYEVPRDHDAMMASTARCHFAICPESAEFKANRAKVLLKAERIRQKRARQRARKPTFTKLPARYS